MAELPTWDKASCLGLDQFFFFEDMENSRQRDLRKAWTLRKICFNCPIRKQCAEWAIENENYGFWGGMTITEIRAERAMRGITVRDTSDALDEYVLGLRAQSEVELEEDYEWDM